MKTLPRNFSFLIAITSVLFITGFQIWTARYIERQTNDLHELLSDTQTQAMQIMNEIGYGGLIHNFKNLILRPEISQYREKTLQSAESAMSLATGLESNAAKLGIKATLSSTRVMISAYRTRVDLVETLHEQKLMPSEIDDAVRFNDDFARREIQELVENLSIAANEKIKVFASRGKHILISSVIAAIALGSIAVGLLINQRQKR